MSVPLAVQALLSLSNALGYHPSVRYYALSLFADRLLPSLAAGRQQQTVESEAPLLLLATACVLIAGYKEAADDEIASQRLQHVVLARVYKQACATLGAQIFSNQYTSQQLREAYQVVANEISLDDEPLTSDYLVELHKTIQKSKVPAFQAMDLTACYDVLELLYETNGFASALESGGKLLASAILASVFVLQANNDEVSPLPLLMWLANLSGSPADVIRAQAECILTVVLANI